MIGIRSVRLAVWAILTGLTAGGTGVSSAQAPAVNVASSELPRPDYYIARDLFDSAQMQDATEGFQSAFRRARQIGQQRWIDSIPPLVMLGECYYQQGSIAMAMEQYDAALVLALANPNWIDQIVVPNGVLPTTNAVNKKINWGTSSRNRPLAVISESIQVAVDPTAAQPLPNGGAVAPVSMVTRLDVAEVLRTLAIALWRRSQYLGPLAQHSPLTEPLVQLFAKPPQQNTPWLNASWKILYGLALIGSRDQQTARSLLVAGSSIGDQFDYYLTPISLLALSQLETANANPPAALANLQDAALIAAAFDQFDMLGEALAQMAGIATATRRVDLLAPLQGAIAWTQTRSRHAFVTLSAAAAELALAAGNLSAFDTLVKQTNSVLRMRQKQISLPRVLAQASFVAAQFAFSQNNSVVGLENLDTAISLMRGNQRSGTATRFVFQTQMALELVQRGTLGVLEGEQILGQLLSEPTAADWMVFPIECLTHITTASLPAYEHWLEFAVRRGTKEEIVARMDRLQRQRLYEALPLGGRLFSWRQATSGDVRLELPKSVQASLQSATQENPAITTVPAQMNLLLRDLRAQPIAVDDRQLTIESKRKATELARLAESFENQLANLALKRWPLDRFAPVRGSLEGVRQVIGDDDLMITWVESDKSLLGMAIGKNTEEVWKIDERDVVLRQLQQLLTSVGSTGQSKRDEQEVREAVQLSASALAKLLFPDRVRTIMQSAQRLIIVPSGNLWYLPFELLPVDDTVTPIPLLARRRTVYLPTIGSIRFASGAAPPINGCVGVTGSFFSNDRDLNNQLSNNVVQAVPNSLRIDLTQKLPSLPAHWLRHRADLLWVAADSPSPKNPWELRILPLNGNRENLLSSWLQVPLSSPSRVILFGMHTAAEGAPLAGGNDLLLPACTLLASGTRSIILSRWPVGGRSSQVALSRLLDELQFESPSSAWQRTAIALWAEQFPAQDELALPNSIRNGTALIDGDYAQLWSGYMLIGDHQAPQP